MSASFRFPILSAWRSSPSTSARSGTISPQALPYGDNSIAKIQAQDVLEHLPFDKVPFVLDEIYRVLKPGGIFRLSVPDYRSPVHKRRSVYDWRGRVTGDLLMGAEPYFDDTTGDARIRFAGDGEAHLWFPRYELITHLVLKSEIRKSTIKFYQGFLDDHTYLAEPFPGRRDVCATGFAT